MILARARFSIFDSPLRDCYSTRLTRNSRVFPDRITVAVAVRGNNRYLPSATSSEAEGPKSARSLADRRRFIAGLVNAIVIEKSCAPISLLMNRRAQIIGRLRAAMRRIDPTRPLASDGRAKRSLVRISRYKSVGLHADNAARARARGRRRASRRDATNYRFHTEINCIKLDVCRCRALVVRADLYRARDIV